MSLVDRFWVMADRIVWPPLFIVMRLVFRSSPVVFLKRCWRVVNSAGEMAKAVQFPPLPVRLQVETTDICNLKCRMCTREVMDGMNTLQMPLEQFEKLVEEADPLYVTLNGLGEPLIDKTLFSKLAFLHGREIMTSMPTNGTYVKAENLDKLAENLPDILQMSVDGATKESFEYIRLKGDFEQIIANYKSILERHTQGKARPGAKIRMLCALQKKNLYDYRSMFNLLEQMPGLGSFHLVPVFDYDAEGSAFEYLLPTKDEVLALHKELAESIAAARTDKERRFYQTWKSVSSVWLEPAAADDPSKNRHACLLPWYNAYVDAKGRVFPCCYLSNSEHVMGNINESSFPEIWHGEKFARFRQELASDRPGVSGCRTCPRNDDGVLRLIERTGVQHISSGSCKSKSKLCGDELGKEVTASPESKV